MRNKRIPDRISIHVPQARQSENLARRLIKLGEKQDRSINYLVVEAIRENLKRHEKEA